MCAGTCEMPSAPDLLDLPFAASPSCFLLFFLSLRHCATKHRNVCTSSFFHGSGQLAIFLVYFTEDRNAQSLFPVFLLNSRFTFCEGVAVISDQVSLALVHSVTCTLTAQFQLCLACLEPLLSRS